MSMWDTDIDLIKNVIADSKTRYEVIQKLNRSPTTPTYHRLKIFIEQHSVDVSHFDSVNTVKRQEGAKKRRTLSNEELFVENSNTSRAVIKGRILTEKLIPYVCTKCKNKGSWQEEKLSLHLEHINGTHNDNSLDNLCFLCPNCHSQTTTYGGKNIASHQNKEYKISWKEELRLKNQPLVNKVLSSNIDFTKYRWSGQVATLIGKNPQKVKDWMVRYMPEFYKTCYQRNTNKGKL